jgi:large subunit ribosomal protein L25
VKTRPIIDVNKVKTNMASVADSGIGLKESQMAQLDLQADSRAVTGKGVRFLRRRGITPLHLFGPGVQSLALQSETARVEKLLTLAGETRLISLTVDTDRRARPVLVRGIRRDSLSGKLLHVDLYQVKMGEKVEVEVPIVLVGEAPSLQGKGYAVLQELDSMTIESFPDKIPGSISVDISALAEPGQILRVRDIKTEHDIDVITESERVVATIVARPEEKAEEKATTTETPAAPPETQPTREREETA